jgi:GT2 family glycosyltransferase
VTNYALTSFVVIAYNEAENIARALDSITRLAEIGEYEIIVVNDASRDSTADVVRRCIARNPRIHLIDLARNSGRGNARQTGIMAAQGEHIATVDADIILPVNWLTTARVALDNCDAVGGTAVPDGDVAYLYRRFQLRPRVVGHTAAVTGSNALYRRTAFELVNFDPALREGEDVALNHALRQAGMRLATIPELFVEHSESKTFRASLGWLFVSGVGATRQLLLYRQLRVPDVATLGFVGAATIGVATAVSGHWLLGGLIPLTFLTLAAVQHVHSRFETASSQWRQCLSAVVTDCALLGAYFAGRVAGVAALPRQFSMQWKKHKVLDSGSSSTLREPGKLAGEHRDVSASVAGNGGDALKEL